jgi:peptidoglycan/LPS O-acetylase OafA/YrhL
MEMKGSIASPKILSILGKASYSIYIIHLAMYPAVRRFTSGVETPFEAKYGLPDQVAWMALLIAAGIGGGLALHYLAEVPIMRFSKRLLDRLYPSVTLRHGLKGVR